MTTSMAPSEAPPIPGFAAQACDVVKIYGRGDTAVRALDGATVAIAAGEFTAVMGPSGSGKSTLMHALAGLDTVDAGHVLLGDTDLSRLTERQRTTLRRDRVGFVFQGFNLIPTLTAAENIALPLTLAGRRPDPKWTDAQADSETLDPVRGMSVGPDSAAAHRDTTVRTFHFCSTGCADTFDTDPDRYTTPAPIHR